MLVNSDRGSTGIGVGGLFGKGIFAGVLSPARKLGGAGVGFGVAFGMGVLFVTSDGESGVLDIGSW